MNQPDMREAISRPDSVPCGIDAAALLPLNHPGEIK